jgi:hypothetical protein
MGIMRNTGYTGGLIEREIFSEVDKDKYPLTRDYLKFRDAIVAVKKSQPYEDPSDPEPRFSNDLQATIADKLGLDDYSHVRIYTAVGSHLDKFHKIDAFVEYDITKNRIVRVTLDVTQNPQKGAEYRADIVFHMPDEGLDPKINEDREIYNNKIKEIADKVVQIFKE